MIAESEDSNTRKRRIGISAATVRMTPLSPSSITLYTYTQDIYIERIDVIYIYTHI